MEWAGPHIHGVEIKNQEDYLCYRGPPEEQRGLSPGHQCWEEKSPQHLAVKNKQGLHGSETEGCWRPSIRLLRVHA